MSDVSAMLEAIAELCPDAVVGEDNEGQVIIYTGEYYQTTEASRE